MAYPANFRYTKQHEWTDVKGDVATIGITDYAQHELGDVVFAELPKVGAKVEAGKSFGTVESVKAVSEIYSPVTRRSHRDQRHASRHARDDQHRSARRRLADQSEAGESSRSQRLDGRGGLRSVHRRGRKEQGSLGLMRYLPKSPAERQEMLAAIGAKSIDELFESIPERFRLKQALNLPGPFSEAEVIQYFKERAAENSFGYTSFLGAGVYNHLRSVVTDAIIQRGEFLTSYTPYQAEITQGTLQAIFEFQTLMCQLTGQQVANASMWDGSTATTEAVLMAERITGRTRVLVARTLHPEYRDVLKTYAKNCGLHVEEIPYGSDGTLDQSILKSMLKDDVGAVVVQSPNFFGAIEPVAALAETVHASRRAAGHHNHGRRFARSCETASRRPTSSRWKARASAWRRAMAGHSSECSHRAINSCGRCPAASPAKPSTPKAGAASC